MDGNLATFAAHVVRNTKTGVKYATGAVAIVTATVVIGLSVPTAIINFVFDVGWNETLTTGQLAAYVVIAIVWWAIMLNLADATAKTWWEE